MILSTLLSMKLRTRITVTFIALLAAVLASALTLVAFANRSNAEREVQRQLSVGTRVFSQVMEANRRQLTQAAQAVTADYGFRAAVATRDTETVISALENGRARIGAALIVLVSLDGRVLAASGAAFTTGSMFEPALHLKFQRAGDSASTTLVHDGHLFQLVWVAVRSPLPVAYVAIGFELDSAAARELASITGLNVTLSFLQASGWTTVVTTQASSIMQRDLIVRRLPLATGDGSKVSAVLSRSLAEARAPFERLTRVLYLIALLGLVISGVVAFLLARGIAQPLHRLTRAVEHIRNGRYSTEVTVERRDELGVLAEGLQLMQQAVASRDRSIRQLAYEDSLTGLMNRTAFTNALDRAIAEREAGAIAVAIIDVQRFRRINECLGYAVGDEVLKAVAARLRTEPPAADAVARLAADQFAAFVRVDAAAQPEMWAATLIARLKDPIGVESQPIDINATVGVAAAPAHATSAGELMRCCDRALEQARVAKRAIAAFDSRIPFAGPEQLSLLGDLQRAVDRDELELFFQPKLDLETRRVAGAEVLLRWRHPVRGLIAPINFIPFAEQTGFVRRMTRWALDKAVAQSARWAEAGHPLPLAVNISAEDIADPLFDHRVAAVLARHELAPGLLTLEITESGFIDDPASALHTLEALAALGVKIAIDDFGTGYSSLSYLARMPVHEVKIDQSFVRDVEADRDYAAVVRAAIDMGHSLGLKVVAEGIETESTAARLRDMNCDFAQGYLFAKPMPLTQLEAWLEGRARLPVTATPRKFSIDEPRLLDATDILRDPRRRG